MACLAENDTGYVRDFLLSLPSASTYSIDLSDTLSCRMKCSHEM